MFRRISFLPGIAISAIAAEHAISFGLSALFFWIPQYQAFLPAGFDPYKSIQYFILIFIKQILFFGVPVFFFVSGCFLAYAIDKSSGNIKWKTIRSRITGLLPPFVLWTILSIAVEAILGHFATFYEYIVIFFTTYWFVPVLILFYLACPAIISAAKRNWKLLLISCGLIQVAFELLRFTWLLNSNIPFLQEIGKDPNNVSFLNWIVYIPLGIVVGTHLVEIKSHLGHYRNLFLAASFVFFLTAFTISYLDNVYLRDIDDWVTGVVNILSGLYAIAFIFTFLLFEEIKPPFSRLLLKISGLTYGIYLTHFFVMQYLSKAIYHFLPQLLDYQIFFSAVVFVIGLSGSILFMELIKKSPISGSYHYLFG